MAMATGLLILLLVAPAVHAAVYTVGETSGWSTGVDYKTWASDKKFAVGDKLVFNYGFTHSLDVVSKDDYDNCNTGNPITPYTSGTDTITLSSTGPMYFICPNSNHCSQGMKLAITVSAASSTPGSSTPTTPSTTPSTTTTPTPPTTTTTTTAGASPPPPSGSMGNSHNMNAVVLGISLVLAPVLALMG